MRETRVLANDALAANRSHREAMCELVASNEAIAFVGAGMSAALNYPSWNALLQSLTKEAEELGEFAPEGITPTADPLTFAEALYRHFESHNKVDQFRSFLGRQYGPKSEGCSESHRKLVKLPFKALVTTNYDTCLEQALLDDDMACHRRPRTDQCVIIKRTATDRHVIGNFLRSLDDRSSDRTRRVAHIHGVYSDTENIVLTASDYASAYGFSVKDGGVGKRLLEWPFHRRFAWSLLATRRLIFFGSSLDDPYLRAMLDAVTDDLWEWDQPIHFAIVPLDERSLGSLETDLSTFRKYNLQLVFYDNLDSSYRGLDRLIEEAGERLGPNLSPSQGRTAPITKLEDLDSQASQTTSLPTTQVPLGIEWLEELNSEVDADLKKA
jgi:SIR2-like domain